MDDLAKLKVSFPNVISTTENEVAISISPEEFATLPTLKKITAVDAKNALKKIGIELPEVNALKTPEDVSFWINNNSRLTPQQIQDFYNNL